jgi:hypothetical protein
MTVSEMLASIASLRESIVKNRDELATYTGFLQTWEDRVS